MINAPLEVQEALQSDNLNYADLIEINLGDAYGSGIDVILYYTNYHHELSFGGNNYTPNNNLSEIDGISRKASTGSDKVEIVFSVTDEGIVDAIKSERYINKPTSIKRVIIKAGAVVADFAIPIRTAWGLSHEIDGDVDDRTITLTIDSSLGDLNGDNGWYAVNSSHQRRYPNDLIMNHSGTVMTEDQQKKYTTNFSGTINQQIKPPSLPKIYGYKNVEAVPICMLKHRKTHSSYRHYFTTLIYVLNIGSCHNIDTRNIKKGSDDIDITVVNNTNFNVGGWSCRVFNASESGVDIKNDTRLNFWREAMDSNEKNRLNGMLGKGLTLLFVKNRNRDDWLGQAPKFTIPIKGSLVFDPRDNTTAYSRNPALQYADFLRSDKYGAGQRGISVSNDNIGELADHFDAIPESVGNAGINSILIDVQLDTGNPIVENMNIWMEGVRLFTSDYYGEFKIRVETISPVVMQINEDDLDDFPAYESGEFTEKLNQLTYSIKQLVQDNSPDAVSGDLVEVDVEATFPEDGTQIHIDWLAEDGGIDNFDSTALDYVTDLEQAYYWAMVDSRISRQPRKIELPMGAIGWLLEVGDVIEFTSKIMSMTSIQWRVDEVSEDDGLANVSLIAYDADFYTPDPSAIPEPVAFAQPPTGSALSPVSGLSIIEKGGLYYLDWDALSSANVAWYAVEITKDDVLIVDEPRIAQPPLLLESIVIGSYQAKVTTVGYQDEGGTSQLDFDIALPEDPTINITAGNFSLEVYPTVTKTNLGTIFELSINSSDDFASSQNKGQSGSFTIANLIPNTHYWVWARTINIVGKSNWVRADIFTLNDNSSLVQFVGLDRESIINDAVSEMQGQIDTAIDAVSDENSQQNTINMINGILDSLEVAEESFNADALQKIEFSELKVSLGQVSASIEETNKVIVDETKSLALQINSLNSATNNSSAQIKQTNQTVSESEKSTATSLKKLTAEVDSKATTTALNQVKSTAAKSAKALSTLGTHVQTIDDQMSDAQLILDSHTDEIGKLGSRIFLGTTTVDGNTERITGIYIQDGTDLQSIIEFQSDTIQFSDHTGAVKFYWDSLKNQFVFDGTIYAQNIEGDVIDVASARTTFQNWNNQPDDSRVILSFRVTGLPFTRTLSISGIQCEILGNQQVSLLLFKNGVQVGFANGLKHSQVNMRVTTIGHSLHYELDPSEDGNFSVILQTHTLGGVATHNSQNVLVEVFKQGSTISIDQ